MSSVPLKVVVEEIVELVSSEDIIATVHHGTSRQLLINRRVLSPIQLIHHNFPNGMGAGRTVLKIPVTLVRHPEVHGVGPEGWIREGGRHGRVVEEGLLLHHDELIVPTHAEVRGPESHDGIVRNVRELLDDDPHASHFLGPVIHGRIRPKVFIIIVCDGVGGNLMTPTMKILQKNSRIRTGYICPKGPYDSLSQSESSGSESRRGNRADLLGLPSSWCTCGRGRKWP